MSLPFLLSGEDLQTQEKVGSPLLSQAIWSECPRRVTAEGLEVKRELVSSIRLRPPSPAAAGPLSYRKEWHTPQERNSTTFPPAFSSRSKSPSATSTPFAWSSEFKARLRKVIPGGLGAPFIPSSQMLPGGRFSGHAECNHLFSQEGSSRMNWPLFSRLPAHTHSQGRASETSEGRLEESSNCKLLYFAPEENS